MLLYFFIAALAIAAFNFAARNRVAVTVATGIFFALQLLLFAHIVTHQGQTDLLFFTYDAIGILFFGLLNIVGIAAFLHSITYLHSEKGREFSFFQVGLILLSTCISGAYFSNNIMVSWIFLEATTLAAAILVYHRRDHKSLEATWKYVFVCSAGMAIAYFGILFLSIMLRGTEHADMSYAVLVQAAVNANPIYLKLAFLFTLIGYSCKMEVFPLYTIGIDANNAAPTPVSSFISTILVNLGFVSIYRVYASLSGSDIFPWMQNVMLITGMLSVLIAAIYLQRVKNLKRLLAYSTVENMGIVLIALGLGGMGFYIAILHTVAHTLIKSAAFLQLSQVGKIYGTYNVFNTGCYQRIYPLGAITVLAALIGLSAMPPSGMFLSELLLFREFGCNGQWVIFTLLAIMLCFAIYALFSRLLYLCYNVRNNNHELQLGERRVWLTIIQLLLLAAAFTLCFYQPIWLKALINDAVSIFI